MTVEPPGRDVWKAVGHLELELETADRAIDFRVVLTKVKVKALGMDAISMSESMERNDRMKWP